MLPGFPVFWGSGGGACSFFGMSNCVPPPRPIGFITLCLFDLHPASYRLFLSFFMCLPQGLWCFAVGYQVRTLLALDKGASPSVRKHASVMVFTFYLSYLPAMCVTVASYRRMAPPSGSDTWRLNPSTKGSQLRETIVHQRMADFL